MRRLSKSAESSSLSERVGDPNARVYNDFEQLNEVVGGIHREGDSRRMTTFTEAAWLVGFRVDLVKHIGAV